MPGGEFTGRGDRRLRLHRLRRHSTAAEETKNPTELPRGILGGLASAADLSDVGAVARPCPLPAAEGADPLARALEERHADRALDSRVGAVVSRTAVLLVFQDGQPASSWRWPRRADPAGRRRYPKYRTPTPTLITGLVGAPDRRFDENEIYDLTNSHVVASRLCMECFLCFGSRPTAPPLGLPGLVRVPAAPARA